jgi:hypothetical protein
MEDFKPKPYQFGEELGVTSNGAKANARRLRSSNDWQQCHKLAAVSQLAL